jgi:hypothetical protein
LDWCPIGFLNADSIGDHVIFPQLRGLVLDGVT